MFSWLFPPSCALSLPAKKWVEESLHWLCEEFDDHAFNGRPIVLPTAEFFPDRYEGTEECLRTLLDRVCDLMDVDAALVEFELVDKASRATWLVNEKGKYLPNAAAGTYQLIDDRHHIRLDVSEMSDLVGMVGTFSHELAHARLLGEGRLTGREHDHELLTDLTTIVFGFGTFLASSPRAWDSMLKKWPGTDFNKPEYMSQPLIAYANAHLAWFRGEEKPAWAEHMHYNARPDFYQALRFLHKTKDSTFRPAKFREQ